MKLIWFPGNAKPLQASEALVASITAIVLDSSQGIQRFFLCITGEQTVSIWSPLGNGVLIRKYNEGIPADSRLAAATVMGGDDKTCSI